MFRTGLLFLPLSPVLVASFHLYSLVPGSSEKAKIDQEKELSSVQGQRSLFILYLSGTNPHSLPLLLLCQPKSIEFMCTLKVNYKPFFVCVFAHLTLVSQEPSLKEIIISISYQLKWTFFIVWFSRTSRPNALNLLVL